MTDQAAIVVCNMSPAELMKHAGTKQLSHNIDLMFNTLPTSWEFCHILIIFANSLDPDQARHNVGPDLDPSFLTL